MSTRNEIKQQKILKILDYGIETFRSKGYHFSGVQELASECGISKGSFYQYFDSKENFAKMVIHRYSAKINEIIDQLLNSYEGTGREKIHYTFSQLINKIAKDKFQAGCLYGDLGAELGGVNEDCSQTLSQCMMSTTLLIKQTIEIGQEDGSIRPDLDPTEATTVLMNSWGGAILKMKIERSKQPGLLFLEHFLNIFLVP
ncbi:MAG: TetR family transcriptional regulator C-terminal domain-containing protein [Lentisphaeraceae bacterium]|nr:TetR family transcriptional regulator C-terminal domain-containing protein [Lentisphaeraceae bacterium]